MKCVKIAQHNMHAAMSIASVTGCWLNEGGGAFHNNGAIYHWDRALIEGSELVDTKAMRQPYIGINR